MHILFSFLFIAGVHGIAQLGGNPAVSSSQFDVDSSHYAVTSARTARMFLRRRERKSPSRPGTVVGFSRLLREREEGGEETM